EIRDGRSRLVQIRIRIAGLWAKRWVRIATAVAAVPIVILCFVSTYYYVRFAHLIDTRLHGERSTVFPRVLAPPLELRGGQSLPDRQLIDRLKDLGYAHRDKAEKPGEFAVGQGAVVIMPRVQELHGQIVRVVFQPPPPARPPARKTPPRP